MSAEQKTATPFFPDPLNLGDLQCEIDIIKDAELSNSQFPSRNRIWPHSLAIPGYGHWLLGETGLNSIDDDVLLALAEPFQVLKRLRCVFDCIHEVGDENLGIWRSTWNTPRQNGRTRTHPACHC
jgi:hypothetical protein